MIKTDESFGIVPLFKSGDIFEVLLIEQISHRGSERKFWTLPKGHAEEGESDLEAATRELEEETGLKLDNIDKENVFLMEYSFTHEDVLIEKKVHFYLGYCRSKETIITQPEEVASLEWFNFEEAKQKSTHENTRILLEKVEAYLAKMV